MYGFHNFETATKLAEQKTNETGKQHCVLHAEDVDGPGGMFTLGVYSQHREISGRELLNKISASTNPLQPVVHRLPGALRRLSIGATGRRYMPRRGGAGD